MQKRIFALAILLSLVICLLAACQQELSPFGVIINGKKILGDTVYVDTIRALGSSGLKLHDDSGSGGLTVLDGGNVNVSGYISATGNITSATVIYGLGLDARDANITNIGNIALDSISNDGNVTTTITAGNGPVLISQANAYDAFRVDDAAGDTTPFVINQSGNVGIGTTLPAGKLHIQGGAAGVDGRIILEGVASSNNPVVEFRNSGAKRASILTLYVAGAEDLAFFRYTGAADSESAAETMRIQNSSGNVGIGTTGPGYKLEVAGTLGVNAGGVTNFDSVIPQAVIFGNKTALANNAFSSQLLLFDNTTMTQGVGGGIVFGAKWNASSGHAAAATIDAYKTVSTNNNYSYDLRFQTRNNGANLAEVMRLTNTGNVGIGTTTPNVKVAISGTLSIGGNPAAPSVGDYLAIFGNATTTPTLGADTAAIFARDVSGTTELFTKDEAGNETQQTSHHIGFETDEPYPMGEWYCNEYLGKCVNVDTMGAIREVEQLTGKTFIHYSDMPESQVKSWLENQQVMSAIINAQRLTEAAQVEIEVTQAKAVESYAEMITRPVSPTQYVTTTSIVYEFDAATGQTVPRTIETRKEVTETVTTGNTLWRLKTGCRVDEQTGKFFCPTGEENAVFTPYEIQPMPDWMQDRITTIFLAPKDISGIQKPEGEYKKLIDVGAYSIWLAKAEAETLKGLHQTLWNMNPKQTLGCLAAVQTYGESFYDHRVQKATGMTNAEVLARRDKIANYLASLGKNVTLLRAATTENELIVGLVSALNFTMQQLWDAME